jgi:hypothetical protein
VRAQNAGAYAEPPGASGNAFNQIVAYAQGSPINVHNPEVLRQELLS